MTRTRNDAVLAAAFTLVLAGAPAFAGSAVNETGQPIEKPAFVEKSTERGPVTARVRVEPAAPVIGDTVTLTIEVTAADGIDLAMPEFGQSLERFSVREFVPRESVDPQGRRVATQRYVLEPPLSGPQSIPPLLIEFVDRRPGERPAPEGEESYEILTERIPFEVASVVPEGASKELRPVRERLEPLREPGAAWPWIALLVVVLAVAAPFAWRRYTAARDKGRRRSAWEVARTRLDSLASKRRPTEAVEIDQWFVELSSVIRRYLEDRFDLRAPELTTEEFLQVAAGSPDLGDAHQKFLRDFLASADMVKFARFVPSREEIETSLAAASRFVDETHGEEEGAQSPASLPEVAHAGR
jgi:hypothetical protein